MKTKILTALISLSGILGMYAQDSLWVRFDNRFKANKLVMDISAYDSIEFRARGTMPVIRRYSSAFDNGYSDYRLSGMTGSEGAALVIGDPGLILWKPRTSDNSYNNDYTKPDAKWSFKHSKESDHFVVFWDSRFGDNPNASSVPSNMRVDIDDLLKKAEQFYETNVEQLGMVVTGEGKSQLDTYKMMIYLLYQTDWLATGSGYDNTIGALWVNPSTCQPVGSTIAHEIGHSFQYQTYCDNVYRGKTNDFRSGFRYGYPESNGGCGFWEQCAQWQSYQDYPSEAINSYHFDVWMKNHHRHFEHEWMRYASYWLQYFWTEKNGLTALGRIWNESYYPEDASQAYMRLFCNKDYDELIRQYFEYAQKTTTFDYNQVRSYVAGKYSRYSVSLINVGDGWKQIPYSQCPQPTGFNVIPLTVPEVGTEVKVTVKPLAVGSALASGDAGTQVDGDGKKVGTVKAYNNTSVAGYEQLAYGFVGLKTDGTRVYGDMNLVTLDNEGTATFTLTDKLRYLWVVVQGAPIKYFQCPWDDKEGTDHQLPYQIKVEGAPIK